jgi:hypothetical protein
VAITVRAASPQDAVCVYNFLGIANQSLVDFGKAIDYHMQCLANAKEVGDRAGEGRKHTHKHSRCGKSCRKKTPSQSNRPKSTAVNWRDS